MDMKKWAEREVELLFNKNKDNYFISCAESALKAFNSLLEDGHSDNSIEITKKILNNLIDNKPLTPIEDIDEDWTLLNYNIEDKFEHYQCKRMGSLFKDVNKETGEVIYTDTDRIIGYDIIPELLYHGGNIYKIVRPYIPEIKMPYMPLSKPYYVFTECFLSTGYEPGTFDTKGYLYIKTPNDEIIYINKFYKENDDGVMVEITEEEYKKIKEYSFKNRKKDK